MAFEILNRSIDRAVRTLKAEEKRDELRSRARACTKELKEYALKRKEEVLIPVLSTFAKTKELDKMYNLLSIAQSELKPITVAEDDDIDMEMMIMGDAANLVSQVFRKVSRGDEAWFNDARATLLILDNCISPDEETVISETSLEHNHSDESKLIAIRKKAIDDAIDGVKFCLMKAHAAVAES